MLVTDGYNCGSCSPKPRRPARAVADHALHLVAHLLGCDRVGHRKRQEARGRHRNDLHAEEIDVFEACVALVDVMDDEIGLAVEQALPRPGDRLEMQVEPRARAGVEEAAQQHQGLRQWTNVADHDL